MFIMLSTHRTDKKQNWKEAQGSLSLETSFWVMGIVKSVSTQGAFSHLHIHFTAISPGHIYFSYTQDSHETEILTEYFST